MSQPPDEQPSHWSPPPSPQWQPPSWQQPQDQQQAPGQSPAEATPSAGHPAAQFPLPPAPGQYPDGWQPTPPVSHRRELLLGALAVIPFGILTSLITWGLGTIGAHSGIAGVLTSVMGLAPFALLIPEQTRWYAVGALIASAALLAIAAIVAAGACIIWLQSGSGIGG